MARILVVDDETDIRVALAEVLSDEGHQVVSARDGAEALACLSAFHPDVVLLDLMMPGMNGWEFRREQKRLPDDALAHTPVVVLSALGREGAIDADDFVPKPFELDDLLGAIRRHAV